MIKKKLITSLALGMCLFTLSTGSVVLAAETTSDEAVSQEILMNTVVDEGVSSPDYEGRVAELGIDEALVKKQAEIEQYVFGDHAEEIIALGFQVTNIGIVNDTIEIGITPFTKEYENYLYEKLGKDSIQITEGITAELYTSTMVDIAPDTPVEDSGSTSNAGGIAEGAEGGGTDGYVGEGVVLEDGQMGITAIDENALDTVDKAGEDLGDGRVYKGIDAEVTTTDITEEASDASYDPQIAEMTIQGAETKDEASSNIFIGIVAGAAAVLVGGIAILARKMRLKK